MREISESIEELEALIQRYPLQYFFLHIRTGGERWPEAGMSLQFKKIKKRAPTLREALHKLCEELKK